MALSVYPQSRSPLISRKNFEEVSDSPKETMKDKKVVRAGAEAIKKKRKKRMTVKELVL